MRIALASNPGGMLYSADPPLRCDPLGVLDAFVFSDADWPSLAPDVFMFASWRFQK